VSDEQVIVVGAGMGGLSAAADLARRGVKVTVVDAAPGPGGKMRHLLVNGGAIDAGPTVFTMKWAFDGLFEDAGTKLEAFLTLQPVEVLARHAWRQGGRLDLYRDVQRSADAVAAFASPADARGYLEFCARSADIYKTLAAHFIASERPSPMDLVMRVGLGKVDALWRTQPFKTLWSSLGDTFKDPRLQQLFGRYATYVGSSPMLAPATLMLIAHVEQDGVWRVSGGMHALAQAVMRLGQAKGATFRFSTKVQSIIVEGGRATGVQLENGERLFGDAVVFNGDASALATGKLGDAVVKAVDPIPRLSRSLSAVTWCLNTRTSGFPLEHHNVFFAEDYADEFDAIFRRRSITDAPTVYICAQDRGGAPHPEGQAERLLVLVNAPADGDVAPLDDDARAALQERTFRLLEQCGLTVDVSPGAFQVTTPAEFEALFPATGGALYGRANHGSMATFDRGGNVTRVPGLYASGGSVHPGPGIPMALLSGRLCAARMVQDRFGKGPSRGVIRLKSELEPVRG
jgi:1-hydroxycarotenoid 3,4-desaturase